MLRRNNDANGEHLVQSPSYVNWRLLDNIVNYVRKRREEVAGRDLRIEEYFRSQEALETNVDVVLL